MPQSRLTKFSGFRRSNPPLSRRQAKAVRKIAQTSGEMKSSQQSLDSTSLDGTASLQVLSQIIQGDGEGQRIGDSIKIARMVWRGVLDAALDEAAVVRLLVIQTQFPSTGTGFTSISPKDFMPNSETVGGKYKILADKIVSVSDTGANQKRFFKISVPGSKMKTANYDAAATTLADGNLMVFAHADDLVSANHLILNSEVKVLYHDS